MGILKQLDEIEDFPTIPTSLARILEVAEDPHADFGKMVRVLEIDPTLTAKVLKVANSAMYGCRKTVSNIERAVALLGFDEVRNIALGLSVFDSLYRKVRGAYFQRQRLWRHSYSAAYLTRYLAERYTPGQASMGFVAGLLHDLGKVLLDRFFPDYLGEILTAMRREQSGFAEAELSLNAEGHEKIGAYLARRWGLPDELAIALEYHHGVVPQEEQPLADVTFLGNEIAHVLGIHTLSFEETPSVESVIEREEVAVRLNRLGIEPPELVDLIAQELQTLGDS